MQAYTEKIQKTKRELADACTESKKQKPFHHR